MHTQPSGVGQPPSLVTYGSSRLAMGARNKPRELRPSRFRRGCLPEFMRVGTPSAGRRALRVTYGEMLAGSDDENLSRRLSEAKPACNGRLEELLDAIASMWRRELEREMRRASSAS